MGTGPSRPMPQPIRGPAAPRQFIMQEAPPPPGTMRVQCPPGSGPGSLVMVTDPNTGQQMQVTVPHGIQAGGNFDVMMPTPAGMAAPAAPVPGMVVQGTVVGGAPVQQVQHFAGQPQYPVQHVQPTGQPGQQYVGVGQPVSGQVVYG